MLGILLQESLELAYVSITIVCKCMKGVYYTIFVKHKPLSIELKELKNKIYELEKRLDH